MEYKNFISVIQERVINETHEKVVIHSVLKNNGVRLDGLSIVRKEKNGAPTIYLNQYYEQFKKGRAIDAIVREIIQVDAAHCDDITINVEDLCDYKIMKDKVIFKLINYNDNLELLKDVPYEKFLDLAIVCYIVTTQTKETCSTCLIHNRFLENWNITKEKLFENAKKNTPKLLPVLVEAMVDFMRKKGYLDPLMEDMERDLYLISNKKYNFGAGSILYDGVLENLSEKLKCDLVIIPSSIHEVLIYPFDEKMKLDELRCMIREVNESSLEKEEILSDHPYIYNRTQKQILSV